MRNYDLNPTAAKEANSGGKRIAEPGEYVGTFRAAWYEQNQKGTEAVHFIFQSEAGQEAGPLSLYTHNGGGEELPSYKTLNAIMACMKVRKISCKRGKVKLYDSQQNAEVEKDKDIYPELIGKRIGLVLTSEDYVNSDGDQRTKLVISAPFNAENRRMASEVLSESDEGQLAKYTDWLTKAERWHKPLKGARPAARHHESAPSTDQFPDDDIPF